MHQSGYFFQIKNKLDKSWKNLSLHFLVLPPYKSKNYCKENGSEEKNYESYYRSVRLQVVTSFEQFDQYWTIFFIFLCLSRSILVYLDLSWFFSVYLGSSRFILIYFDLFWFIPGFLELPPAILYKYGICGLSQAILVYLGLSRAILSYLELSRAVMTYL